MPKQPTNVLWVLHYPPIKVRGILIWWKQPRANVFGKIGMEDGYLPYNKLPIESMRKMS